MLSKAERLKKRRFGILKWLPKSPTGFRLDKR